MAFAVFQGILIVTSVVLLMPYSFTAPPSVGLDPSWAIGTQLAIEQNLAFGREIVFNFGPLGYLATRLPIGIGEWQYPVWAVAYLAGVVLAVVVAFRESRTYGQSILTFLAVLVLSLCLRSYTLHLATLFLFFLVFLLFLHLRSQSLVILLLASLVSIVTFFVKVNAGIPAMAMMFIYLLYLGIEDAHYSRRFVLVYGLLYLAATGLAALLLNANLPGYVVGALHLISGHNEAMFVPLEDTNIGPQYVAMAASVLLLFVAVTLANFRLLVTNRAALLRYAFVGLLLFLLFKHGFVRPGESHVRGFFAFAPATIGLLYLFERSPARARVSLVYVVALAFSFAFAHNIYSPSYVLDRFRNFTTSLESAFRFGGNQGDTLQAMQASLAENLVEIIGRDSVDVVPWEISHVYANDLLYNPRPVIQSYLAYNEYLDTLNYEKYASPSGPDYILYTAAEVDSRLPFSSEAKTRQAMMAHYSVMAQADDFLLLARRATPRMLTESTDPAQQARIGETIELADSGDLQYLSADISYNLLGKLAALVYQPPLLTVTVELVDGQTFTYRAIRPLVNHEVLINRLIDSQDAAHGLFSFGLAPKIAQVTFDTPDPWGMRKDFRYTIKHIQVEDASVQGSLPVDLAGDLTLRSATAILAGERLAVDVLWQGSPLAEESADAAYYTAFVQLLDDQSQRLAGSDVLLSPEMAEVSVPDPQQADVFISRHEMMVPPGLSPGRHPLLMGLYFLEDGNLVNVGSVVVQAELAPGLPGSD
jgi:hypothetical protein